jgi:exoribonuclease-2
LHSGLGLTAYAQVSSPIRRYSDMVCQRQLIAALRGDAPPHTRDELQRMLASAESMEVETRHLEERATTYWLLRYLVAEKANTPLGATVLDRRGTVELEDYCIQGRLTAAGAEEPGSVVRVLLDRADPLKGELRLRRA